MTKTINVNLLGLMYTTKVFLPDLVDGGHLVNMASFLGTSGVSHVTDYCASKFGVVGFHEALRQEHKNTYVSF